MLKLICFWYLKEEGSSADSKNATKLKQSELTSAIVNMVHVDRVATIKQTALKRAGKTQRFLNLE